MSQDRLTDLSYLRQLMERHGVFAKKKYGQNFLINAAVPARIAEEGCPSSDWGVLEIGPGMGTLTCELCKKARRVVALEIDRSLEPVLEETLAPFRNVRVIFEDVLKTDLSKLCAEEFADCAGIAVCANLPYYITTPVLMYLLESGAPLSSVTVMVQKEVADRITARAGTPEYGSVSAAVRFYGKAEKLFKVLPGSFYPAPTVESCVMRITVYEHSPYEDLPRPLLFKLISAAFEQRRKTLNNALRGVLSEEERLKAREVLRGRGFPDDVRGEKLDIDDFAAVCRALS